MNQPAKPAPTALITGASAGVGAATARLLATRGYRLVINARGEQALQSLAATLADQTDVLVAVGDVMDDVRMAAVVDQCIQRFGGLDVLVNNAGMHHRGPFASVEADNLSAMVDANLRAPVVLTRLALPHLLRSDRAAVINVASLAGRAPVPGSAVYSATKFGLRALTFALAEEHADTIKFAVVSPGPIDTGFIMDEIDEVSDLTFSQPISTAAAVAVEIARLIEDGRRESAMPWASGVLTQIAYLFPSLSRALRPALERKGQRVKQQLRQRR